MLDAKKGDTAPSVAQTEQPVEDGRLSLEDAAAALLKSYEEQPAPETPEAPPAPEATEEQPKPEEHPQEPEQPPAEPEGEDASEEAEVLSQRIPEELKPRVDEIVRKRIEKSLRKQREAQEQAEKLKQDYESRIKDYEEKLQQAVATPPPIPVATPDSPLAHVMDEATLIKEAQQARQVMEQVEDLLDTEQQEIEVGGRTFTRQQLKQIYRNAKRTVEEHVPMRQQWLRVKQEADALAQKQFPFLFDKNSKEYLIAQQEIKRRPYLANAPDGMYIVGLALKGLAVLQAEQAKATTPKPVEKPKAPPVPEAATAPLKPKGDSRVRQEIEKINARIASGRLSRNEAAQLLVRRETLTKQLA